MIINPRIPLNRLVLVLSEALDHVNPSVADHQLRVACMSTRTARLMGFQGTNLRDVFHAGALHDIGLIRAVNRIRLVANNDLEGLAWHGEAGYTLLKDNEFFAQAAPLMRYHHSAWCDGHGSQVRGQSVPMANFILGLADDVDRHIRRNIPILHQVKTLKERLVQGRGKIFHPNCVDAFLEASKSQAFWLDVTSRQIHEILNQEVDWPTLMIDESAINNIAMVFGRLVDSLSPWTGTHSAGVATIAVALGEKLNFSPREQVLIRVAGYLHDLGKISVPSEILDKKSKPTEEEWAILHGHTYHTFGILNAIGGMPQISEWAAFHHERLDGGGYPFGHDGRDLTLGARIVAVADTIMAITEDRPYRKGMSKAEALSVLDTLVDNGGLDGQVVATLRANFDYIDSTCRKEQAAYGVKQNVLAQMIGYVDNSARLPEPG